MGRVRGTRTAALVTDFVVGVQKQPLVEQQLIVLLQSGWQELPLPQAPYRCPRHRAALICLSLYITLGIFIWPP